MGLDLIERDTASVPAHGLVLRKPYLIFLGDISDPVDAKTAFGLRDWIADDVVGQWRTTDSAVDLGLPNLSPAEAVAQGARSLVIGAAFAGGQLPDAWTFSLKAALSAGLDVVSGMHTRLNEMPALAAAAARTKARLIDVRTPPSSLPIGDGRKRTGKRLLTVGADCAIGKKYAALAIAEALARTGMACDFRATGQTGIMIAGGGIPIDSVVADFIAGAAELLSPDAAPEHWDVIEGQGSLFHPSYAGVSLGLLHGSQPDGLVYCHSLTRTEMDGMPGYTLPSIELGVRRNVEAAQLTNPDARLVGLSVNTAHLSKLDAYTALDQLSQRFSVPCIDPLRFGAEAIAAQLVEPAHL